MDQYNVLSAIPKGNEKALSVKGKSRKQFTLRVPRFACVGPGDRIAVSNTTPQKIWLVSKEDLADLLPLVPPFRLASKVVLGAFEIDAFCTEVTEQAHLDDLSYLEQFHYKTSFFLSDGDDESASNTSIRVRSIFPGGRRVVLVLYLKSGRSSTPAGYIDLQMPLMMCKPRHDLFDNPFEHSKRPISWAKWDQHAIRNYVNLIVRIARVVVSPDFRGLGLARHLVTAAQQYAQTRWNIGGRRPLFLEISAEMLRYVDFVTSAGFQFVGWTEGNLNRVVADLSHMAKGYKVSCGIMSLQKKYVTAIQHYADNTSQQFDTILARLKSITQAPDPAASLSPEEWAAFRSVLRLPRPYFLLPLDADSRNYLAHNLKAAPPTRYGGFRVKPANIILRSVAVRCSLVLQKTKNVRLIMDCFGLHGDILNSELLPPLSVKASGGNIVLIVGPSGSGKSVLLTALDPQRRGASTNLIVDVQGEQSYSAGWIKPLPEGVPLFDYFAERYSAERAFRALSNTGLSEAFVFIKPFSLLSRGQQYRAMLADLLLRDDQVWLLDEFCSDLDPISAKVVVHNFRRHVMSTGRIAFVAAANHRHYVDVLRPTQVILLRAGGRASVLSFRDYNDELFYKAV